MAGAYRIAGMGWLPDYPDIRDYGPEQTEVPRRLKASGQDAEPSISNMLATAGVGKRSPGSADLREWFSPIEDQGQIGSCTAHAGVGLVEYFERRAFGKHIDASRLFLYKVTRDLLHWEGDTGAFLRSTMMALVLFGVPPEEYWPYVEADYEKEPTAFSYAFAQSYQSIQYYRLDAPNTPAEQLLVRIKDELGAGLPCMFGFTVYDSIAQADSTGRIPAPAPGDKIAGGHAVVAAGYDDKMRIRNSSRGGQESVGAFLVRNSWGAGWGEGGYGWLPYDYVLRGLAEDWWSILKCEWVDTGEFGDAPSA